MSTPVNYSYGNKANWRRWQWNRIAELCPTPRADLRVLYLPGPEDNDRNLARRHGFRDWNLVGVERVRSIVGDLRRGGAIVVDEDARLVLQEAPDAFAAVLLDFTGDISTGLIECLLGLAPGTAVALNFWCGHTEKAVRESSGFIRHKEVAGAAVQEAAAHGIKAPDRLATHRGYVLLTMLIAEIYPLYRSRAGFGHADAFTMASLWAIDAAFSSYKSELGNTYFDSIVFRVNPNFRTPLLKWGGAPVLRVRQKLAAAKALSTMRRRPWKSL